MTLGVAWFSHYRNEHLEIRIIAIACVFLGIYQLVRIGTWNRHSANVEAWLERVKSRSSSEEKEQRDQYWKLTFESNREG
ncbi:MAG: hypothetical protein KGS45_13150 [Planctomycetes bacterium]|nr:hypothetical protein [Planctomycetota bacterium]